VPGDQELGFADFRGIVERVFLTKVEAFERNCPQHIGPRFTEDDIARASRRSAAGKPKIVG
jgi:hypothetical protein